MPNDGEIRIIVSAGLSRDVEATFGAIPKMAERAAKQAAKAMGESWQTQSKEAEKGTRATEKAWNRELAELNRIARAQDRIWEKQGRDRQRLADKAVLDQERALRQETRNAELAADKQVQAAARAARKIDAEHQRFASRVSHRSVRFMFPNPIGAFGMASRIGGDILRGAGVDMSISGSVGRAVSTQALATQLSNQGYMKGEAGPNGQRVAATTLEAEARATAKDQRMDPEAMLRAQTKFVDITGNLNDARAAMPNIAALSGASGTDPEKMAEAWANVSRHMGDVPDKAQKVYGLMKLITGQGRVGSDEIKNMAPQLAKLAASADRFAGKDKAKTIASLTTLSQLAKAEGGAASSAQAATSVARFTDLFSTPARVNAMLKGGLKSSDLFETDGKGNKTGIKDPLEIIKKALTATGGDLLKMNNMFKSVMAARALNGLTAAFTGAGGGKAGLAAVDKQFATFGKEAAFSDEQIKENNEQRKGTDAAKAQEFQNALDGIIAQSKNELGPALTELQGPALQAAHYLSEMVSWAAKNPMEAVGLALTGAIARASVETAMRSGIEKLVTGAMTSGGLTIAAPVAITIASAVVAMTEANKLAKLVGSKERAEDLLPGFKGGSFSMDQLFGDFLDPIAATKRKAKVAADIGVRTFKTATEDPAAPLSPTQYDAMHPGLQAFRADHYNPNQRDSALQHPPLDPNQVGQAVAGALRGVTLNVREMSPRPAGGGPVVDPAGRDLPPGPWRR